MKPAEPMPEWQVELIGRQADIDALMQAADSTAWIVKRIEDDRFALCGGPLERCGTPEAVREVANEHLGILNGFARVRHPDHRQVKPSGTVIKVDPLADGIST